MPRFITLAACALMCAPLVCTGVLLAGASPSSAAHTGSQPIRMEWIRKALMLGHYQVVLRIQDAVIRDELDEMRPLARELATEAAPPRLPAGVAPHVDAMRAAARRTAEAVTLENAAEGTARLLTTCGACHRATGTTLDMGPPPPRQTAGVAGHMRQHEHAMALMLEGLVGPSDAAWLNGASALRDASLRTRDLASNARPSEAVLDAETTLHALGDVATSAKTSDSRITLYARMLTTCGRCHGAPPSAEGRAAH